MQPDPALLEKQKHEQMMKKQQMEHVRVITSFFVMLVETKGRWTQEAGDYSSGRGTEESDDGHAKSEHMG